MRISELYIFSFKNLGDLRIEKLEHWNAFWGRNGQGKSNLLEALCVALRGKSFRFYSSKDSWISSEKSAALSMSNDLESDSLLGIRLSVENDQGEKHSVAFQIDTKKKTHHFWDEKRTVSRKIKERIPLIVFSPEDQGLLRNEPEGRRNFLFEVFSDVVPGFAELHADYTKSLKNRNRLLKDFQKRGLDLFGSTAQFRKELGVWDKKLSDLGWELSALTKEASPALAEEFAKVSKKLFSGNVVNCEFNYHSKAFGIDFCEAFESKEHYEKLLLEKIDVDCATGWTHFGPHRDDFRISIDGFDSKQAASQGQNRLLVLSLKWTHSELIRQERSETPIFFLDDFSNELDEERRQFLVNEISGLKAQVLLTGTSPNSLKSLVGQDFQQFWIEAGQLQKDP